MKDKQAALQAMQGAESFTAAAKAAQIDRRTLWNWLNDDRDFYKAYYQMQHEAAVSRADALEADRRAALEVIKAVMADAEQSGITRLKAAELVLKQAESAQAKADKAFGDVSFGNDFTFSF